MHLFKLHSEIHLQLEALPFELRAVQYHGVSHTFTGLSYTGLLLRVNVLFFTVNILITRVFFFHIGRSLDSALLSWVAWFLTYHRKFLLIVTLPPVAGNAIRFCNSPFPRGNLLSSVRSRSSSLSLVLPDMRRNLSWKNLHFIAMTPTRPTVPVLHGTNNELVNGNDLLSPLLL